MACEEVATAIGAPFSCEMIIKRFKNMKETFLKNLGKVKASKRSGSGLDDLFRPTWYLYSFLLYLEKACAQSDSTDNLSQSMEHSQIMASPAPASRSAMLNATYNADLDQWVIVPQDNQCLALEDNEQEEAVVDDPDPLFDMEDTLHHIPEKIPRPSSAPILGAQSKKSAHKEQTKSDVSFNKRGSTKASTAAVLENAVKAFEKIASAPPPTVAIQEMPGDAFCSMLNVRLSRMSEESRQMYENEILKVLLQY